MVDASQSNEAGLPKTARKDGPTSGPGTAAADAQMPLHLFAASMLMRRSNGIDEGKNLAGVDAEIARIGARIESSDSLRQDPLLAKFARLAASLLEGDNAKRDRAWDEMQGMVTHLVQAAAAPEAERRVAAIKRAASRAREGLLTQDDLADLKYVEKSLVDAFETANTFAQKLIAIRDGGPQTGQAPVADRTTTQPSAANPNDVKREEAWELRALRGALTPDEAFKLAESDPTADDRTREQHRRSLQSGGQKALAAVWLALQAYKALAEVDAKLSSHQTALARLSQAKLAVANVETAMKDAGWDVPASVERLDAEGTKADSRTAKSMRTRTQTER